MHCGNIIFLSIEPTKDQTTAHRPHCLAVLQELAHVFDDVLLWDMRSLGILRNAESQFCTDVSTKPTSPAVQAWNAWPLKMGPISCVETSVRTCHSTLRKIPEERRYHFHRRRSLNSRMLSCPDGWVAYAQAFVHFSSFPVYSHTSPVCFLTESVFSSSTSLSMICIRRQWHRIHEYQTSPKISSVDFPNNAILVVGFCDHKGHPLYSLVSAPPRKWCRPVYLKFDTCR